MVSLALQFVLLQEMTVIWWSRCLRLPSAQREVTNKIFIPHPSEFGKQILLKLMRLFEYNCYCYCY